MTRAAGALGAVIALGLGGCSDDGERPQREAPDHHAMAHHNPDAPRELRLVADRGTVSVGRPAAFGFRIADVQGTTVRHFEVEQARRLHLIVVRSDLSTFAHLHPRQQADGSWTVPMSVPEPGRYRVYADFVPTGGERTTAEAFVEAPGDAADTPLPPPADTAQTDGYTVRADGDDELTFLVMRDGRTVDLEPYLGAGGHLVAIREDDLAYSHVHPVRTDNRSPSIHFMAEWDEPGTYRLFLQFRDDGRVHTAAFTRRVP